MSEATKRALHDAYAASFSRNWVEIVCAIDAHVKDEVAAARAESESKPEPGSGAKGPPETLLTVLDDDGYHIETRDADDANTAVAWVRADVAEKEVAVAVEQWKAKTKYGHLRLLLAMKALGATPEEDIDDAARRVVADRDAVKEAHERTSDELTRVERYLIEHVGASHGKKGSCSFE